MEGAATGVNADGTVNVTGEALNDYATQDFSNIIDTSTVAGKLLAEQLGEVMTPIANQQYWVRWILFLGSLLIVMATLKYLPAQGVARNVSRTSHLKVCSTAKAAMATALMEAH